MLGDYRGTKNVSMEVTTKASRLVIPKRNYQYFAYLWRSVLSWLMRTWALPAQNGQHLRLLSRGISAPFTVSIFDFSFFNCASLVEDRVGFRRWYSKCGFASAKLLCK